MEKVKGKVFIVQGPTASGKTSLAIDLARKLQTEIISADSRQFYREMSIGTAKPTEDELRRIKHHFIHSHSIHQEVSASQFATQAKPVLDDLLMKNGAAVIVGGSGMFIDALTFGLDDIPHDAQVQEKWTKLFHSEGLDYLQSQLEEKDPEYFKQVDIHNPVRLIRALEVIEITGGTYSELRLGVMNRPYQIQRFCINWERADLYARIDQRVERMISEGLLEEAKSLFSYRHIKALNTVGYAEFFSYWENEYSYDQAIEKIKQHTRNYAKRQLTWLKRYSDLTPLNPYNGLTFMDQIALIE